MEINNLVETYQNKSEPYENSLTYDWAKISFKERIEILKQFEKLKEIEKNLKLMKVSLGISFGYSNSDFKSSIKS